MIITIPLGIKAMIIGHVIISAISFIINGYLPGKFYHYGPFQQLKDIFPFFTATLGMAIPVFIMTCFINSLILQLFLGIIIGIIVYLLICWILKLDELIEVKELFLKLKK